MGAAHGIHMSAAVQDTAEPAFPPIFGQELSVLELRGRCSEVPTARARTGDVWLSGFHLHVT